MRIEVLGKGDFRPSEANRAYALKKLSKLEDFFGEEAELKATVLCKYYNKNSYKVEVTIPAKNLIMRAEASESDLYAAIDKALDKLLQQCRKYKTRVKSKLDKEGIKSQIVLDESEEEEKQVVKNKELELEPMSREEAISQMELLGHDFFIYLDKDTHKVNVLYLRNDGNYANIETK